MKVYLLRFNSNYEDSEVLAICGSAKLAQEKATAHKEQQLEDFKKTLLRYPPTNVNPRLMLSECVDEYAKPLNWTESEHPKAWQAFLNGDHSYGIIEYELLHV